MSKSKVFSRAALVSFSRSPIAAAWLAAQGLLGCSGEFEGGGGNDRDARPLEGSTDEVRDQGDDRDSASPTRIEEGGPNPAGLDGTSDARGENEGKEGDGSTDDPPRLDVPDTEHCAAVADWDPEWAELEEQVLLLVNEARSQRADCGVEGVFEPAPPLTMNPILRCSARLHSLDMFERDFFDHDNPDGVDPFQRMDEAGFVGSGGGENIAVGQTSPEEVMEAWMGSDGHCANVMRDAFDTLGVGYHPGAGQRGLGSSFWTQNFGAPPFTRGGQRR